MQDATAVTTAANRAALAKQIADTATAVAIDVAAASEKFTAALPEPSRAAYIRCREAKAAATTARTAFLLVQYNIDTVNGIAQVLQANKIQADAHTSASGSTPVPGSNGVPNVIAVDSVGDAWVRATLSSPLLTTSAC